MEHEIICDHVTKRSRGFGFIIFDSEKVVDNILSNGNMIDMEGTQVSFVQWFYVLRDAYSHISAIYKAATKCCNYYDCCLPISDIMHFFRDPVGFYGFFFFWVFNLNAVQYSFLLFSSQALKIHLMLAKDRLTHFFVVG